MLVIFEISSVSRGIKTGLIDQSNTVATTDQFPQELVCTNMLN